MAWLDGQVGTPSAGTLVMNIDSPATNLVPIAGVGSAPFGRPAGGSEWKFNRQFASYTSTSMTTSGKQSWQYGRFEMCGKIPISAGMWPAYYQGKILVNVASGTATRFQAKWDSATRAVDAAWASSFHLWRMDWSAAQIDLYFDDKLMNTAN